MKTSLLVLGFALACALTLSCVFSGLHAQEQRSGRKPERPNYSAMATGAEVRSSAGEAYAVLAEARAAPGARRDEDSAQALSRMGLAGREVLERKGRYVIYREAPAKTRSTAGVTLRLTGAGYPVLLNKQTGNLAVVTGNLRVKLKSGDITAVASAHGLTVTQEFTHLGTAFLSAPEGADLLALLAALRADPRIAEADLELFEHVRVPH